MRGLYSHSLEYRKILMRTYAPNIWLYSWGIHSVRMYAVPVFEPARIQKNGFWRIIRVLVLCQWVLFVVIWSWPTTKISGQFYFVICWICISCLTTSCKRLTQSLHHRKFWGELCSVNIAWTLRQKIGESNSEPKRATRKSQLKLLGFPQDSGESKVLVFSWVWPFNMHAPYILSADDLDDFSGILRGKPCILAADDLLGACYRKAMTPQKASQTLDFAAFCTWKEKFTGLGFGDWSNKGQKKNTKCFNINCLAHCQDPPPPLDSQKKVCVGVRVLNVRGLPLYV